MHPVTHSVIRPAIRRQTHRFTPGDLVVRFVNDEPFVCLVIGVEDDQHLRVTCTAWPSGYSAIVKAGQVVRLAQPDP